MPFQPDNKFGRGKGREKGSHNRVWYLEHAGIDGKFCAKTLKRHCDAGDIAAIKIAIEQLWGKPVQPIDAKVDATVDCTGVAQSISFQAFSSDELLKLAERMKVAESG